MNTTELKTRALDAKTDWALTHAVMEYDRTQAHGTRYNPNALGLILRRLQQARAEVESGESTLAQALYDNFNDRLLSRLEKSAGLPLTYGGGGHDKGRPG